MEVQSWHLLGGTEEHDEKKLLVIAAVPPQYKSKAYNGYTNTHDLKTDIQWLNSSPR
jgi:hypothetical protein